MFELIYFVYSALHPSRYVFKHNHSYNLFFHAPSFLRKQWMSTRYNRVKLRITVTGDDGVGRKIFVARLLKFRVWLAVLTALVRTSPDKLAVAICTHAHRRFSLVANLVPSPSVILIQEMRCICHVYGVCQDFWLLPNFGFSEGSNRTLSL